MWHWLIQVAGNRETDTTKIVVTFVMLDNTFSKLLPLLLTELGAHKKPRTPGNVDEKNHNIHMCQLFFATFTQA